MVSQKLTPLAALAILAYTGSVSAAVALYGQCGGNNYTGETVCVAGAECHSYSEWYSQCIPATTTVSSSSKASSSSSIKTSSSTTSIKTSSSTSTTKTSTSTSSSASASSTGLRHLHKLASAHGRYFGTALDGIQNSSDAPYVALSGDNTEFGVMTPGNAQKWAYIEATHNVFSYTNSDAHVAWAVAHGQVIRGHTLVWHSQLASWVSSSGFTAAQLTAVIQNHIANVAGHFAGKLYAWDVVNEAVNDSGTWRSSVFYDTLGTDFIPIALKAARLADPTAKLYLNDYNVEGINTKSTLWYNFIVGLIAAGVPLDGFGMQAHLIVGSVPTDIQANIQRFADLGLDVAITELDIRYTLPSTTEIEAQQATDYTTVTKACIAVKRCVGITTWDTSDDHSWIPSVFSGQGGALLFDANKQPKAAYFAVANTLATATINGPGGPWV